MKNKRFHFRQLLFPLFSSCSAAVVFTLFAPVAIYLGNAEEFRFTLYDFWFVPAVMFLFCTGVLFLITLLLRKISRQTGFIWGAVLFTLGILVYLQGSFLFEDTGVLNGSAYLAAEHREHILQNSILWGLPLLFVTLLSSRAKHPNESLLTVLTGLFSAFVLLALAVLLLGAKREYLRPRESFVSDRGLLDVSDSGNVIIIVPDMFDADYMKTIYAQTPELLEDFTGFTWFDHVDGCFFSTKDSLSHFFRQDELFDTLEQENFSLGIYTDARFLPTELQAKTVNILRERAKITDLPRFTAILYRLVACGYAPDLFRESVWLYGDEFDSLYAPVQSDSRMYTTSNTGFYQKMKTDGISVIDTPCFRMFHLYGVHYPYVMDEYLHPILPSYSDANALSAARGTLRILAAYLKRLKETGVYDSALIVIMADHGYTAPDLETDPLLMIHRPGSSGRMNVSEASVSQANIASLIESIL